MGAAPLSRLVLFAEGTLREHLESLMSGSELPQHIVDGVIGAKLWPPRPQLGPEADPGGVLDGHPAAVVLAASLAREEDDIVGIANAIARRFEIDPRIFFAPALHPVGDRVTALYQVVAETSGNVKTSFAGDEVLIWKVLLRKGQRRD